MQRVEGERLFVGSEGAGRPVAAVQVSCVARGRSLFGEGGVDLDGVSKLVGRGGNGESADASPAVAGFFANGEMGPVGLTGFGSSEGKRTHIHGFTTVMAVLCDFSKNSSTSASGVLEDADAWG
uniref:Uncharacterized protein n=1 Tax=Odontella aurita TaxID=265563 RepID=A0A7S4MQK6_9STRA|mmetsp:Transcript_28441/g.83646  ORF Transcript_28441/g.83646 Transcript_28441/m.83646 type:complete len:124 (+) Transcript_28441:2-373(+)